jgi:hypothetical protein
VIPNTAINNNGRAITITLAILSNKSKMGKYAKYNKKYCSAWERLPAFKGESCCY